MQKCYKVTTTPDGCTPTTVQVFYNDEHALTLGIRQVQVKQSCSGTTGTLTTNYPVSPMVTHPADSKDHPQVGSTFASGDQAGTDVSDRPMFPALFVTDVTYDPNSLAGDWQYNGTCSDPPACTSRNGIPPHFVSGTWKAAIRIVDHTNNTVTVTPDADPAKNNWTLGPGADPVPPGLTNEGYGAEIRWNIAELRDSDGNPLQPGHTYRLYFMEHDGDQNKTGGDSGQGCAFITMPGGPAGTPTPTPTASPTPTPTPTATPGTLYASGKTLGPSGATKTIQITFQNDTASSQVLTGLQMTWPQGTNGNLRSIKMGGTTIFNTSTANPPGLNTSSLLGTNAQRTIAAGSCATLTFTFTNNVSTNPANYTGSATFNPFGPVTMFP